MELFRKYKFSLIISLTSLFSSFAYFLWRRYTKSFLPPCFVQRLLTIKSKYEPNKILTEEICYTIENICIDIGDFFYYREHMNEENMRILLLDGENEEEYEELCFETISLQHHSIDKAHQYLNSFTGILYKDIREYIDNDIKNKKNFRDLKLLYRTKLEKVPDINKDTVKEAYIYYLNNAEKTDTLKAMMSNKSSPQQQQELYKTLIIWTCKAKDRLQHKYKIDHRIINDLIDKHNLWEDEEIMKLGLPKKLNELTSIKENEPNDDL